MSAFVLNSGRAGLRTPPSSVVEWVGTSKDDGRAARTHAQLWKSAVDICAAMLGVTPDRVECVRADEQRLSGNGTA
jgi:hypothetical protein